MAKRRKNRLVERVEYLLFRLVLLIAGRLDREGRKRWGARIGDLARRVLARRTQLARRNVELTFPELSENEVGTLVRDCWRHYGWMTIDYLARIDETHSEEGDDLMVESDEPLRRALAHGRGIVLCTAHFGLWERAVGVFPRYGIEATIVARAMDNPLLDDIVGRARRRSGIRLVSRRKAARDLVRTLEKGGVVLSLPDQAVKPREGMLVPFLGRPAWTTPAPARLSLRFDAAILLAFCIPDGEGVRIVLDDPVIPSELAESERTPEALTRRINERISEQIRLRPSLWLWMHDRWKWTDQ